jgi:hypothetical protein
MTKKEIDLTIMLIEAKKAGQLARCGRTSTKRQSDGRRGGDPVDVAGGDGGAHWRTRAPSSR